MRSTEELEHQIRKSGTPSALVGADFDMPDLAVYLTGLLHSCGLSVQDVVVLCNLDRSYGYQLFNGTRRPTRDFLLLFAVTVGMEEAETQRLLKIARRQPLYARNRRDAAVLYGLSHGLTAEETDALLHSLGEEGLL